MKGITLLSHLNFALQAAVEAGKEIEKIYYSDSDLNLTYKADQSPVTQADYLANQIISTYLEKTGLTIISEEAFIPDYVERKNMISFWLVDPLDGTKEFINKTGDFTVNIALIEHDYPIAGVIYIPIKKQLYFGIKGTGGFVLDMKDNLGKIPCNWFENALPLPFHRSSTKIIIPVSRSTQDIKVNEWIDLLRSKLNDEVETTITGSAIKFCQIADGTSSMYPRFEHLKEWDIAAGQAIIEASGGMMMDMETKQPVKYNTNELSTPGFIAVSDSFKAVFNQKIKNYII